MSEELRAKKVEFTELDKLNQSAFEILAENYDDACNLTSFLGDAWRCMMQSCPTDQFKNFFTDENLLMCKFLEILLPKVFADTPKVIEFFDAYKDAVKEAFYGQEKKQS